MDLNAARRYRVAMTLPMTLRRFSLRLCALTIAYALALQGLLVAMTAQPADAAAGWVTCLSADDTPAPAGQNRDHQNHGHECVLHCLAFHAPDAWTPPRVNVVAKLAPSNFDRIVLAPAEISDRPALDRPQSPRAPPRA